MKITKLELKNFKRFDDLTIDLTSLAGVPKLVLLIGTNGSGKSSVFDAFEAINKRTKGYGFRSEYYNKYTEKNYEIYFTNENNNKWFIDDVYTNDIFSKNLFYVRTSVRQVPKLTRTSLGQNTVDFKEDTDRPETFIERDNRFENDIEKITSSILTDVFSSNSSTEQIKEAYINPINKAFENIFSSVEEIKIKLISIKPPLEGKTAEILFEKGSSKIPYDYLSSGEKEIFNILLNLLTRREFFTDTVYFFDEIDLHLNTLLQKNLLKEITENWIPENCQLWTASHSLGFIEYANESESAAIIDLDSLNFDLPQVVLPSAKNNTSVFEIAVSKEFLANIFEGKKIFFSENTDTSLYNNLNIENTIFFNANNKADVFHKAKNNPAYNGLVDRDFLTDIERIDLLNRYENLFILDYYSIENYLFHPSNLEEYYQGKETNFDIDVYREGLITQKLIIRDKILMRVGRARDGYPFYRENENAQRLRALRTNEDKILELFDSDNFETFYKVFPAKDYGTEIKERQNINRIELAKTEWFKNRIINVLRK